METFYKSVSSQYLNIRKELTDEFLQLQGDYIVGKVPKKQKTNAPIATSVPMNDGVSI